VIGELVADGVTVFLTTQYLEEADRLADRIAVIDGGRVIAEGTPSELKRRVAGPRLDVVAAGEGADAAPAGRRGGAAGGAGGGGGGGGGGRARAAGRARPGARRDRRVLAASPPPGRRLPGGPPCLTRSRCPAARGGSPAATSRPS